MRILVVGGGGREHAIIWKLKQNKEVTDIFCAPGNGGIGEIAKNVPIGTTEIDKLLAFALSEQIDLTVVGPDDPLVLGIVDVFQEAGLKIFGPQKSAAMLEGSKAYAKAFMKKYNIPTASYEVFQDPILCMDYIRHQVFPVVVKADGLALGKGVVICENIHEAEQAVHDIMIEKKFGDAGSKVVVEEFLVGVEVSLLAFSDGEHIIPMVSAQDHKRIFDGDKGLNTGGMGTFSPSKAYDDSIVENVMASILQPTVQGLVKEGTPFVGIIFFGLILTPDGPKVIEYNCRFGDPETQVVLPRLRSDLLDILMACLRGNLHKMNLEWEDNAAACVVLASGGYPQAYEIGLEIYGLPAVQEQTDTLIFHAGTKKVDGKIVTAGGRVLGVTGISKNLDGALKAAYRSVGNINFESMHYRKDIGVE